MIARKWCQRIKPDPEQSVKCCLCKTEDERERLSNSSHTSMVLKDGVISLACGPPRSQEDI